MKDSPANGTSAAIARMAFPSGVAFFLRLRGVSPSPAAWRACRDLASGSGQRL